MSPPPLPDRDLRVSVVVSTRNRAQRLGLLLEALRGQTIQRTSWELVVVDDASTDATQKLLAHERERGDLNLRPLRRDVQAGPATARDEGWRAARGEWVAFIDDDCEPSEGWLAAGLEACGEGDDRFVQGRTLPNPRDKASFGPFSRTIKVPQLDPHFHTCNIFYRRELLERLDGFDTESFGLEPGGEDSDLAWRAIAGGARPLFSPPALVFHAVSDLGPVGKLRVAARWTTPMKAYAMHPNLRRSVFIHGVFWKREHLWLTAALLAPLLPRRLAILRTSLMLPYLRSAYGRARTSGAPGIFAAYFLVHDLVEVWAVVKAALRYRRVML